MVIIEYEFPDSLLQSSVSHDPSEIIVICWLKTVIYLKDKSFVILLMAFSVTIDQFNASLLNKSTNLFKKKKIILTPKYWTVVVRWWSDQTLLWHSPWRMSLQQHLYRNVQLTQEAFNNCRLLANLSLISITNMSVIRATKVCFYMEKQRENWKTNTSSTFSSLTVNKIVSL